MHGNEIGLPLRYRVDEYSPKQKRWLLAVVTYRDCERQRLMAMRHVSDCESEGITARIVDLKPEPISKLLRMTEEAHQKAANSTLHFGCA